MLQYCLESTMDATSDKFDRCLAAILREHRGYAPGDENGPTNHGISQAQYSVWREENALPDRDVWRISFEEVEAIYAKEYWIPSHAEECPAPLDLMVFKCAIESGPRWAIRTLQQALGLQRDGVFCQKTRDTVSRCDGYVGAAAFLELRETFFRDLIRKMPERTQFLKSRLDQLEKLRPCLKHIGEGILAVA